MRTKKILIAAVVTALATGLSAGAARSQPAEPDADAASQPIPGSEAILHLFGWNWDSVAAECTRVLGPAGFPAVEVSAPQEHVVLPDKGYPWWQDYQPVSYRLDSRRGTESDFADMVAACDAAGVDVYVDTIVNHMAGGASTGTGSGGSTYSHYEYPAVPYGDADFHHCGRNGTDDIENWTDHWEVRNCELVDLADLATETEYVRDQLVGYMNRLIGVGVDGFRIDAAKHVPAEDLRAIYDRLDGQPKIFQEVIEGGEGEIGPEEYTDLGRVTEFRYGDQVGARFADGNLAALADFHGQMRVDSSAATSFIDNHDTQRNGRAALTYKDGARYVMAEAFALAHDYGAPHLLSGFAFDDPEAGPPSSADGTTEPAVTGSGDCAEGWECSHRAAAVLNLGALRVTAADAPVTDWWSNGSNQIGFGRGDRAYVAFNAADTELTTEFATQLPDGTYCDVANGTVVDGGCTGPSHTVSGGKLAASVPAEGVLAVHLGSRI